MMKLALQELVMRGIWGVVRARDGHVDVKPGGPTTPPDAPPPLPTLDRELRLASPSGGTVLQLLTAAKAATSPIEEATRADLVSRGLIEMHPSRVPWNSLLYTYKTDLGRAWIKASDMRVRAARRDPQRSHAQLLGGLILLVPRKRRGELWQEFARIQTEGLKDLDEWQRLDDLTESVDGLLDIFGHEVDGIHDAGWGSDAGGDGHHHG